MSEDVDSTPEDPASVGETGEVVFVVDTFFVIVGGSICCSVGVCETDGVIVRIVVESMLAVAERFEETIAVGEMAVGAGTKGCGVGLRSRSKKRINSRIATINLKRS